MDGNEWVEVETYFGEGAAEEDAEEGEEEEEEDVVYVLGAENEIHGPYTLAVRFFCLF